MRTQTDAAPAQTQRDTRTPRRLGYKVALLDADIGLRNLDLLLGLENRVLYTAIDILEGECRLDQALIRDKRWKNLSLLSISRNRQR